MSTRPRVLLLSLRNDWLGPPRLAAALAEAGLEVAALCPDDGPLSASRLLSHRHHFNRSQPPTLPQLLAAFEAAYRRLAATRPRTDRRGTAAGRC